MSDRVFLHFRVKFIIEEIERDEAALREDLYSADRKFAEYYNVGEKNIHIVLCKPKI
jgi:HAUS augmin-like complex subunit 4